MRSVLFLASKIVSLEVLSFNDLSVMDKVSPTRSCGAVGSFVSLSFFVVNIILPIPESFIHFLTKRWDSIAELSTCVWHQWAWLDQIIHACDLDKFWKEWPDLWGEDHSAIRAMLKSYDRRETNEELYFLFEIFWLHRSSNKHLSSALRVSDISRQFFTLRSF